MQFPRVQVGDARNAQLKHVRKTDGKNDRSLDTTEDAAKRVLAGGEPPTLKHSILFSNLLIQHPQEGRPGHH